MWLLQNLGFEINWGKSVISPCKQIEYLCFIVDSVAMKLYIPEKKVAGIRQQCLDLLWTGKTSVRLLAKVIGKLTATIKTIRPAPLQYRHLQHLKSQVLHRNHQNYETVVALSVEFKQEMSWWAESITVWNGRSILKLSPDLAINISPRMYPRWAGEHSDVSCPIICQELAEDICSSQSRQYNNGSICEQDGWRRNPGHVKYQQTTLELLPSKGDHNYCQTPTWLLKSNSGCSVETVQRHKQLDVGNPNISNLNESSGTSGDQSVCGSHEQTTGQICQLEAGPRSMEDRCFLIQMDRPEGVHLPSILSSGSLSGKNPARQSNNRNQESGILYFQQTTAIEK